MPEVWSAEGWSAKERCVAEESKDEWWSEEGCGRPLIQRGHCLRPTRQRATSDTCRPSILMNPYGLTLSLHSALSERWCEYLRICTLEIKTLLWIFSRHHVD